MHQLHNGGHHALWFAGHMGTTDNFMSSLVRADLCSVNEEYGALFGLGSQPSADLSEYTLVENVLGFLVERREKLLLALEEMTDHQLADPTPDGASEFMPDNAAVFEIAIWHEGLHSGQISLIRRSLGFEPLV